MFGFFAHLFRAKKKSADNQRARRRVRLDIELLECRALMDAGLLATASTLLHDETPGHGAPSVYPLPNLPQDGQLAAKESLPGAVSSSTINSGSRPLVSFIVKPELEFSSFVATINWGDGMTSGGAIWGDRDWRRVQGDDYENRRDRYLQEDKGVISTGIKGTICLDREWGSVQWDYYVSGTHTYRQEGEYIISVSVTCIKPVWVAGCYDFGSIDAGWTTTIQTTVKVVNAPCCPSEPAPTPPTTPCPPGTVPGPSTTPLPSQTSAAPQPCSPMQSATVREPNWGWIITSPFFQPAPLLEAHGHTLAWQQAVTVNLGAAQPVGFALPDGYHATWAYAYSGSRTPTPVDLFYNNNQVIIQSYQDLSDPAVVVIGASDDQGHWFDICFQLQVVTGSTVAAAPPASSPAIPFLWGTSPAPSGTRLPWETPLAPSSTPFPWQAEPPAVPPVSSPAIPFPWEMSSEPSSTLLPWEVSAGLSTMLAPWATSPGPGTI